MKNCDLLIHALFTASVGSYASAMSIEDEQHNKKSILTHPFFHTAFPAAEEEIMMMIVIIKAAFRQLDHISHIIYRDRHRVKQKKNWAKVTFNLLPEKGQQKSRQEIEYFLLDDLHAIWKLCLMSLQSSASYLTNFAKW